MVFLVNIVISLAYVYAFLSIHLRLSAVCKGFRCTITLMGSTDPIKQLGSILRAKREAAGLSTRALVAKAGVNDSTIVHLEQGLREAPRPDILTKLARARHLN